MIIIKIGGSVLDTFHHTIINDIKNITKFEKIIFVHGGGKEVSRISEQIGKKPKFIVSASGIRSRYTDEETIEIFTMVMAGKINKTIVKTLQKNNINAVGISGIDGKLIQAHRKKRLIVINERGRKQVIDGGYTGKVEYVNNTLLELLIKQNYIPVVAPIAVSDEYEFLNIDGDRAAASIAGSMRTNKMIFLTNVDGVFIDQKLVRNLNYKESLKIKTKVGFGMEKKILASIEALEMGVGEVLISNGNKKNPIKSALEHDCTVIKHD